MSWWSLDTVLKQAQEYWAYYRSIDPVACPRCGEPLRIGPPQHPQVLYCRYDGWAWPEDYDADIHAGM